MNSGDNPENEYSVPRSKTTVVLYTSAGSRGLETRARCARCLHTMLESLISHSGNFI